ncbi:MAG: VWA domain-containing protein [Bdellovibrionales bacterium]|nr:VWA domain-containing protein [Bdellovibrionales bacterium]
MNGLKLALVLFMVGLLGCQDVAFELTEQKVEELGIGETSFVIEENRPFTNKADVGLSIYARNADEMYITSDSTCESSGEWVAYKTVQSWSLTQKNKKINLYIKFRNKSGFESSCISDDITHDDVPPKAFFQSVPEKLTNQGTARFSYSVQDDLSGVDEVICWDNTQQRKIPCDQRQVHWNLIDDGKKSLWLRVVDRAGNSSETIGYDWVFDQTPPEVRLLTHPTAITNSSQADFTLQSSDENGVQRIECGLAGAPFQECQSFSKYEGLPEGTNIFQVRARDRAGNISPITQFHWLVDRTPPKLSFTKTPLPMTADAIAQFSYSAVDTYTSFKYLCKTAAGAFEDCESTRLFEVKDDGQQQFFVKARDAAGNESQPIRYEWLLDRRPPELIVEEAPQTMNNKQEARLKWRLLDAGSGIQKIICSFQNQIIPCAERFEALYRRPKVDQYLFKVVSEDKVGNRKEWVIDWNVQQATVSKVTPLDIKNRGPVDVLFVIDNSQSMSEEQDEMGKRFDNFLDYLSDLDWQVGITTTDPQDDEVYGDGKLVPFKESQGLRFLDSSIPIGKAHQFFRKTIKRDEWGSSVEQGIYATYRAIERMDKDVAHQQFFRKDSHLSVVLVSDENESDSTFRNKPEELIKLVKNKWPEKTFKFHSIVARPGDNDCDLIEHTAGKSYAKLTQLTGGILGDVCAKNYSNQLANIGEYIRNLLKRIPLDCEPVDVDHDGRVDLKVAFDSSNVNVPYKVEGRELVFSEPPPLGSHRIEYTCYDYSD